MFMQGTVFKALFNDSEMGVCPKAFHHVVYEQISSLGYIRARADGRTDSTPKGSAGKNLQDLELGGPRFQRVRFGLFLNSA